MKKFLAIILCLCIFVLPMKVVALDCPQVLGTVATNEQTELTAESETLYPANSPEAQAIEKIHAHMRASGETVSIPRSQASGLIDGGIYNIKNYFSGKYLNVCYGTDANGTNVYQYTKDGSVEQKFKVVYDSSTDSYKLYAMCSSNGNNRVIDVKRGGAALASGQNVDIWTPVDHTAQRLEITYLTYNIYHISMKANTGLYLTTRDSSNGTKAGTSATSAGNVHINSFDVNLNQQWAFEYLGTVEPEPTVVALNVNQIYSATLTLNDEHIYTFSPSQTGTYVVQTTGSTDTYGTVNTTINGTVISQPNDDDGEGYNFNIMFYATSGDTIQIKVRHCYPSSGQGPYSIRIHKARAQIYTFNHVGGDINTTLDGEIPQSGFSQLGYDTYSYSNQSSSHAFDVDGNGFTRFNSEMVFFSGHGGYVNNNNETNTDDYSALYFYETWEDVLLGRHDSLESNSLPSNMNNVRLAVWNACYSGNEQGLSIAKAAFDRGAKVSIGWEEAIHNTYSIFWNQHFFTYVLSGYSIDSAIYYANYSFPLVVPNGQLTEDEEYINNVVETQIHYGDLSISMVPVTFVADVDLPPITPVENPNTTITDLLKDYEYIIQDLSLGGKRYVKTINGLPTNEYYDVYPDGNVLYAKTKISNQEINEVLCRENNNTQYSVAKNAVAYDYEGYHKIDGEIIHLATYTNDNEVVCINLENGTKIDVKLLYDV